MKNFFIITLLIIFSFSVARAQITLDATFPSSNFQLCQLSIIPFGYGGEKYVLVDKASDSIEVFSLNQVLEKSFSIPSSVTTQGYSIYYISDNLFDLDSSIEYLVNNPLPYSGWADIYVVSESGNILLTVDTATLNSFQNSNLVSEFSNIFPSTSGTKLILKQSGKNVVYSLPGSLPCYECSNGVFTGNFSPDDQNKNGSGLSNPYPNPTSNLTRIDYQLPNGIKQGELVFYNTVGNEVKRFKVTGTFSFIYVSARDLPSGTYYYNLQTSAGSTEGKKMVVIQ